MSTTCVPVSAYTHTWFNTKRLSNVLSTFYQHRRYQINNGQLLANTTFVVWLYARDLSLYLNWVLSELNPVGICHAGDFVQYMCTTANTWHSPDVVPMLGQRRRRRHNIETALGECLVYTGWTQLVWTHWGSIPFGLTGTASTSWYSWYYCDPELKITSPI